MKTQILAAVVAIAFASIGITTRAATPDATAVTAVFSRAIAAFNSGDLRAWTATCASPAGIIDEVPPHAWHGASACSDWWSSYQSDAKATHVTGGIVTLGKPWHATIDGSSAYIVWPASFSYRLSGKPAREAGIFTVALTKASGNWLISAWSWAQH